MGRYSVTLGPNTKQLWVYDSEKDAWIDPPAEILDELDDKFDWDQWDEKEDALQKIVNEEPDWLFDEDYTYDAEETEI